MNLIQTLQQLYVDALDCYKTEVDGQGDVIVKYPRLGTLYIRLDERDPEYFRLVYPIFCDSEQALRDFGVDEAGLYRVLNEVNSSCKAVTLYLHPEAESNVLNVSMHCEAFLAAPDTVPDRDLIAATFDRYISTIEHARWSFFEKLKLGPEGRMPASSSTEH